MEVLLTIVCIIVSLVIGAFVIIDIMANIIISEE